MDQRSSFNRGYLTDPITGCIFAYLTLTQDEDIDVIHQQLEHEYGAANFEAFINLLVSISSFPRSLS